MFWNRSLRYSESVPEAKAPHSLTHDYREHLECVAVCSTRNCCVCRRIAGRSARLAGQSLETGAGRANLYAAIVLAGIALAIGWIVAAAVH